MQPKLRFSDFLHPRPVPRWIDAETTLQHFAIITYCFDPERFESTLPKRFQLDTIEIDGVRKAMISVVPFVDLDFGSAVFPFFKFRMGQTNYRIYIVDRQTGEKCVWFLGTTLDSWTQRIPYHLWKLPWHRGKMQFNCEHDAEGVYSKYHLTTSGDWASNEVELCGDSSAEMELPGFPDVETGLVVLTHPLRSFYFRRDGKVGSYGVWHQRLNVKPGRLVSAQFSLLDRLGLVPYEEQQTAYSVMLDAANHFTIYLPPRTIEVVDI